MRGLSAVCECAVRERPAGASLATARAAPRLYSRVRVLTPRLAIYPDPETFKPGRYLHADGSLKNDVPYPTEAFGFGRRICPGRYFAHDNVWMAVANILAVFTIEPPLDENGKVVKPRAEFTPQFLR